MKRTLMHYKREFFVCMDFLVHLGSLEVQVLHSGSSIRTTSHMRTHSYMNFPYNMNNDELLKTIWVHKKKEKIVDCRWYGKATWSPS
jgi:hypothetical protein